MTAEIVIMNRSAIAIAADSAVTIMHRTGPKIDNTANKLFNLTIHHPVAAMIYGNGEILGLPWETVIKEFRRHIGLNSYSTLAEYAHALVAFIDAITQEEDEEIRIVAAITAGFCRRLAAILFGRVEEILVGGKKGSKPEIQKMLMELLLSELTAARSFDPLPDFSDIPEDRTASTFGDLIFEIAQETLPIDGKNIQTYRTILIEIVHSYMTRSYFSEYMSGLVVAGFGVDERLPRLVSFEIEGRVFGRLKKRITHDVEISPDRTSVIIPFAQSEMVGRFMEGIDGQYQQFLEKVVGEFAEALPDLIFNAGKKSEKKRVETVRSAIRHVVDKMKEEAASYRRRNFVDPIIDAVRFLPKDEMAALAESLVQLTSLKRKMSTDLETVGEPIDVAVVSKGDGFIWIKRKHYFEAALNPRFMQTYVARYAQASAGSSQKAPLSDCQEE